MSRLRLTACVSGATAEVATAAYQISPYHWPADLVQVTTSLRRIDAGTVWLATRLHEAANQILDPAERVNYPRAALDAASHLPGPMATITDHCRQTSAGWKSVAAHHSQTLATHSPRITVARLAGPLEAAAAVLAHARDVAGAATQQQVWPIDWVRATELLRTTALTLAVLAERVNDVLAVGALSEPALSERAATRTTLRRIRAHYRTIAAAWLDTIRHLDALDTADKTLPAPADGQPAIGM